LIIKYYSKVLLDNDSVDSIICNILRNNISSEEILKILTNTI